MDHLARWLRKEDDPSLPFLRLFAFLSGAGFLIALGAAIYDAQTPPLEPAAYFVVALLGILALTLGYFALRNSTGKHVGPPLAALHAASWQGKLAETLGDKAVTLETAARDLEQAELLGSKLGSEKELVDGLIRSAHRRMRRMVDLSIHPPAHHGLSLDEAPAQIDADALWIAELRRLLETFGTQSKATSDLGLLEHLKALADAHEEARLEIQA